VTIDEVIELVARDPLAGAWPITVDRLRDYMLKAAREATQETSWTSPNPRWDEAVLVDFPVALLEAA
jgi:(1->4)-alpha-D-glucan 1-alpha-D-glucosylmutase